jgi:RNA polymerase sigma-70 factor (sigma-E family)
VYADATSADPPGSRWGPIDRYGTDVMEEEAEFAEYAAARQHRLLRTAFLLCGDANSAQDLAQEALTNLCRAWSRARRADSVDAYARRTLINVYLSHQRRLSRDREAQRALVNETRAFATAEQTEQRLALLAALDQLGKRSRAVLVLRYWEDMSVQDTADALGCSVGTVKSQTSRGLDRLRDLLGPEWLGAAPVARSEAKGL